MTPIDSTIRRLRRNLAYERADLERCSRWLGHARRNAPADVIREEERRYCMQLDRVWHAQETLKDFNPSLTMATLAA